MTNDNRAFELKNKIQENERIRRALFAENAEFLREIRDDKLYKELLGDDEATWAGFLSDPEIFYPRNRIHTMMKLLKKFGEELELKPEEYFTLPHSRLLDIYPIVTRENWEDWRAKLETLTTRDWRIETREAKGLLTEEEEHIHHYDQYLICKDCGAKHKADHNIPLE